MLELVLPAIAATLPDEDVPRWFVVPQAADEAEVKSAAAATIAVTLGSGLSPGPSSAQVVRMRADFCTMSRLRGSMARSMSP